MNSARAMRGAAVLSMAEAAPAAPMPTLGDQPTAGRAFFAMDKVGAAGAPAAEGASPAGRNGPDLNQVTARKNLGKLDTSDVVGPVVVLAMDRDTDSLGRYQRMVGDLRRAGIRAEMYLGGAGMKAQMKYADRRGAPCVVIQGGDERVRGVVQIKDLVEGARMAEKITDNAAWREGRPAQVEVAEADIVATVKAIIAAQKAERG